MNEQAGYIKALDGSPLYAVFHPAKAYADGTVAKMPVVIAPPLFEERKSAYAPLRRLAARLAEAGHAALRFDYRGSGESGGDPARRRWSNLAEDLMTARKTLAKLTGKRDAVLLGLRLGATLALQESIRVGGEAAIALAPIAKGASQVRLWKMRSKIRAEMTELSAGEASAARPDSAGEVLDFDGFEVNPSFFNEVEAFDLTRDLARISCPALIAQISARSEPNAESSALLATLGSRARLETLRMEPFWDKLDEVDTGPLEEMVLKFVAEL